MGPGDVGLELCLTRYNKLGRNRVQKARDYRMTLQPIGGLLPNGGEWPVEKGS
jgi:hypothetical protein